MTIATISTRRTTTTTAAAPTRARRARRPRRGRAGAVYVEAILVVGFLVIVGGLIRYVHGYYRSAIAYAAGARECMWARTARGCTGTPAGRCGGYGPERYNDPGPADLVAFESPPAGARLRAAGRAEWLGAIVGDDRALPAYSIEQSRGLERPAVAGGGTARLHAAQGQSCNEPRGAELDLAERKRGAFCRALPEWCN